MRGVAGQYAEMGWGDSEEDGRVARTLRSGLFVMVTAAYWVAVWLMSGLAPLGYKAARVRDKSNGGART